MSLKVTSIALWIVLAMSIESIENAQCAEADGITGRLFQGCISFTTFGSNYKTDLGLCGQGRTYGLVLFADGTFNYNVIDSKTIMAEPPIPIHFTNKGEGTYVVIGSTIIGTTGSGVQLFNLTYHENYLSLFGGNHWKSNYITYFYATDLDFNLNYILDVEKPNDSSDKQLTSGVTIDGESVAQGAWNYYSIAVPTGATDLTFVTTNATDDIDIYASKNKPTDSSWFCRPYLDSGNETCYMHNPKPGTWWVGVYGYKAATYSITGTFTSASSEAVTGTVQSNQNWTFVNAPSGYLDAVVFTGPPTYHGADPGVVRLRNISDLGFELRFQEWDYRRRDHGDTNHAVEDIPYVVLQPGRHLMADGSEWEVGTFPLSGTGTWASMTFSSAFAAAPKLFLTVQTYNGNQAISLRVRKVTPVGFEAAFFEEEALMDGHAVETVGYLAVHSPAGGGLIELDSVEIPYLLQTLVADERWIPVLSHRLKVEEEQSFDNETGHIDETLNVLALGDRILAQQVSNNGGDTTALRRLEPTTDTPMEWGLIRGIDHAWQTLPFARTYDTPVVVAKPASNYGGDPGVIRIKGVTSTHAQLRYEEWDYLDAKHLPEELFYLVSEAGEHRLGGLTVEADLLVTNKLGRAGQWESLPFNALFKTDPAVLASVMTYHGADTVTTRIRNLDISGFELAMDEQENKTDGHINETLGWIAIQSGSGTTSEGRKLEAFFEPIDHNLTPLIYPSATTHRHPTVVGDVDSTNGGDPVFLRYAIPSSAQIKLKLTEERSADTETAHALEDVGLFVAE